MSKEYRNIGELYKERFEEFECPGDSSDWNELAYKLDKKEFFKFNISRFNIYYSSLIVITFILSVCVFVRHTILMEEDNNLETVNPVSGERRSAADLGSAIEDDEQGETEVARKNPFYNGSNDGYRDSDNETKNALPSREGTSSSGSGDAMKKDTLVRVLTESKVITDTLKKTSASDSISKVKPKVNPKPKKIVYITKQDTIVKYDTLRKKKRNKLK